MTEQGIKIIQAFLVRVDLRDTEIPAFNAVLVELQAETQKLKEATTEKITKAREIKPGKRQK